VTGQFQTLAKDDGLAAIVALNHVPFGNSYFATQTCGGGPYDSDTRHCWAKACVGAANPADDCFQPISAIVAQHGAAEYKTNRGQAVAQSLTADTPWNQKYWPFVVCSEKALEFGRDPDTFLGSCATQAGIDATKFSALYGGAGGDALVVKMAKATFDHEGTPWILVNGQQTDPEDLVQAVCDAYQGEKPSGCSAPKQANTCV